MWFYIKICQNQQFVFLVMCDVWYGRLKRYTVECRLQLWTQTIRELVGLYRVICGPLNMICGTVSPIQSDVQSSPGDMRFR